LNLKVDIKIISSLNGNQNLVSIFDHGDNDALDSALMGTIKGNCNPKETSEDADSRLIIGPKMGELWVLQLGRTLAVISRDLSNEFDFVVSEARESI
jgi:hypothetical protein